MLIAKANLENAKEIFRRASLKSEPVIFSTDTIYGIGAPLSDSAANLKIFDIKGREADKPFPVLISSLEQLDEIAFIESAKQTILIEKIWPAPVTLIMKAKSWLNPMFTQNGTIAVRMPDKDWLRGVISKTGPISATSANLSGRAYVNNEKIISEVFQPYINFYIFDNNIRALSSAIIDISSERIKVVRASPEMPDIDKILG